MQMSPPIFRLWTTGLVAATLEGYEAFAGTRSLSMFRSLPGCLGVLFLRSDRRACVVSLWEDQASIDALATNPTYQATVKDLLAAGFLEDPQQTEVMDLHGGFLEPVACMQGSIAASRPSRALA
jgi:quinol monooxygenase YgiN